MYVIKDLLTGLRFSRLDEDTYYWELVGDKFDTFEEAKKMQEKFNLYNSAIIEAE